MLKGQELIDNFIEKSEISTTGVVKQSDTLLQEAGRDLDDDDKNTALEEVKLPEVDSTEKTSLTDDSSISDQEEVGTTKADSLEPEEGPEKLDDELDESYFTETLAKIYVKQQRYDKALEIIKKLNLKYPKKNAYFADQIRFLEKLIINAKSK